MEGRGSSSEEGSSAHFIQFKSGVFSADSNNSVQAGSLHFRSAISDQGTTPPSPSGKPVPFDASLPRTLATPLPPILRARTAKRSAMLKVSEMVKDIGLTGHKARQQSAVSDVREKELPHVLDGYRILHRARASKPYDVYMVDLSGQELHYVIEEDLALFEQLHTIKMNDNTLSMGRLASAPAIKHLEMSLNEMSELELEADRNFPKLEYLDVSFNKLQTSALLILAALPSLKHLDLSSNEINHIPISLTDMTCWRDEVLRMLLKIPPGTAKSFSFDTKIQYVDEKDDSEQSQAAMCLRLHEMTTLPIGDRLQKYGGPGFLMLDTLILDNNRLGPESLHVLSSFTNLKKLSLNNNRIISLQNLSAEKPVDFVSLFLDKGKLDTVDYIDWIPDPDQMPHYKGFQKLEQLHLSNNDIVSSFDLIGLVYLKNIRYVWLEGNPVMVRKFRSRKSPMNQVPASTLDAFTQLEFNPLRVLPQIYKIQIMDECFRQHRSPSDKHVLIPFNERKTKVTGSHHQSVHHVSKVRQPVQFTGGRRPFKFSDEDILHIIRHGEIPSIKELTRIRESAKRSHVGDTAENDATLLKNSKNLEKGTVYDMEELEGQDELNSNDDIDHTFITSVKLKEFRGQKQSPETDNDGHKYTGEESDETSEEDEPEFPAPATIQQSVRALRHAIFNPMSYWRVVEESYTKPTQSSLNRVRAMRAQLKGVSSGLSTAALGINSTTHDIHYKGKYAPWKDARRPPKLKPMDTFDEMHQVAERMDEKLKLIDDNLETERIMNTSKVGLNASSLLEEFQSEYSRIEDMYMKESRATIDHEKKAHAKKPLVLDTVQIRN